ncbi:LD-carboxypeptidase [Siminovitchia sediminis]|uniref:LD-carboxypeptidase n=1 Tax=Siminovitchia sediminis TaxID=1274353 RepID=A0ABW4KDW2_9BACI
MKVKKVKALQPYDTVGLTAPAGPVKKEKLAQAVTALETLNVHVEVGNTCYLEYRSYLAGRPRIRAEELNNMFSNEKISMVFCLRGGYGSPQILPYLNCALMKENPKLLVGYSDITALHGYMQQCGIPSIHGPMPATDLIQNDSFTINGLIELLKGSSMPKIENPIGERLISLVPGKARGILTGGNLSLICALMGTPYEIDTKGKILFLEEINEEPYKLDRMITQLALGNKLADAEGIILGTWEKCSSEDYQNIKLPDLFKELLEPYGKPVLYNLRAGHCSPMVSLPFGANLEMDSDAESIIVTEGIFQ